MYEICEEILYTGTSSFKQPKQNGNQIRIEGGEPYLVNSEQSILIRSYLGQTLINN